MTTKLSLQSKVWRAADGDFLSDLYATAKRLVEQFHLAESGSRLIVNGGKYQDFPYLHFHLVSDLNP